MATAADIMTRNVVTVSPDTPVHRVAELLANQRFGSVPVAAEDGAVLGIVTEEGMITRASEIHLPRHIPFLGAVVYLENPQRFEEEAEKILATRAADIMDREFAWVRPDTPVERVAARMLEEDLRRLLVLEAGSRLVGIITRADIVRMLARGQRAPEEGER